MPQETTTGGLAVRGPYHEWAAGTDIFAVHWQGKKVWRWAATFDPTRARNSQAYVVNCAFASGAHDLSLFVMGPDKAEAVVYSPSLTPSAAYGVVFERMFSGPSSAGGTDNAVALETEDALFSNRFLETFRPVLAQLTKLALLEEGWDSYGAPRIEEAARYHTVQLLGILFSQRDTVPLPIVGPCASGAVVLQWKHAHREVYVEVGSDVCDYYVARPEEEDVQQHGIVNTAQLSRLAPILLTALS